MKPQREVRDNRNGLFRAAVEAGLAQLAIGALKRLASPN
jgi:hypothetical protein